MDIQNIKLHKLQRILLSKLSLSKGARFNDLLIENLPSEHMNYHLKRLLEYKLVIKDDDKYKLTDSGKDYVNLLDDETKLIEKQPKTSILINAVRLNSDKQIEYLVYRRLKQPYLGKILSISGKVRFGEGMEDAAKRELYEETGLTSNTCMLENIYRKVRYRENGDFVQDVLFYTFFMTDFRGKLIERTPYQENMWITEEESKDNPDFDFVDDFSFSRRMEPRPLEYNESIEIAEDF